MVSERQRKVYELYELFNDYNRITILLNLYNEEITVDDLVLKTNLNYAIVLNNIEYLCSSKVLKKKEIDEKSLYEISDKTLNKLIGKMLKYVEK